MSYYPVSPSVPRSRKKEGGVVQAFSMFDKEVLPQEMRQQVFERDDYTCQCCGFRSEKYQDIHFKNNDKTDTRADNLITTCLFCSQCFHIDDIRDMKSGTLIWLPEIGQAALHHIARSIYVARISQGDMAQAARETLEILMARREEAKKRLGTDDPFVLATVLKDYLEDRHYKQSKDKLEGIRVFPLDRRIIQDGDMEFNQFPQILAYWRSKKGPFGGNLPADWFDRYIDLRLNTGDDEKITA